MSKVNICLSKEGVMTCEIKRIIDLKLEVQSSNPGCGTVSEKLDLLGLWFHVQNELEREFKFSQVAFSPNILLQFEGIGPRTGRGALRSLVSSFLAPSPDAPGRIKPKVDQEAGLEVSED